MIAPHDAEAAIIRLVLLVAFGRITMTSAIAVAHQDVAVAASPCELDLRDVLVAGERWNVTGVRRLSLTNS
jgi:hypothetical protein